MFGPCVYYPELFNYCKSVLPSMYHVMSIPTVVERMIHHHNHHSAHSHIHWIVCKEKKEENQKQRKYLRKQNHFDWLTNNERKEENSLMKSKETENCSSFSFTKSLNFKRPARIQVSNAGTIWTSHIPWIGINTIFIS